MKGRTKLSRRDMLAGSVALGISAPLCAQAPRAEEPFIPSDSPNTPIGVGKGIHPGRVVWVHNPGATRWDGTTGEWWDDANTDARLVDSMVSKALRSLTGKRTDKQAWDALFRHFNQSRNLGNAGYRRGEKITIKINANNDRSKLRVWSSGLGLPSPQVVNALLYQLVKVAGVPGRDITVYDVAHDRHISDPVYQRVRANADPNFRDIKFMVSNERAGNGRVPPVQDKTDPIRFSQADVPTAYVPSCLVEAKYRINLALFRPHGIAGVTLTSKNNFGSIYFPSANLWGPAPLHKFISKKNPMGSYNPLVDIIGHRQLGGKTMLYMIDGLYAAEECEAKVIRFLSFGDHWTSSLFMSQDPVAIDSVGLDFLRNEPRALEVRGNPDNFLHEAALAEKPPSGTVYDPSQDGTRLSSLGVHEHWNNPADKKYSRNLGTGEGIELVVLS